MTPHWGNTIIFPSIQQLPRLCLGPLKSFLSWHDALQGPLTCLVHCFQNYIETRTQSGTPRQAEKPQGTFKNSWRKPWLCVRWKRTCLQRSRIVKSQQNIIELVTRPGNVFTWCGNSGVGGLLVTADHSPVPVLLPHALSLLERSAGGLEAIRSGHCRKFVCFG